MLWGLLLLLLALPFAASAWVGQQGRQGLYRDLTSVPKVQVALLLGTAPTVDGRPNLYYTHRIAAAGALYRAGKFEQIIASGARRPGYDEIGPMQRDLMAAGIPPERIQLDPGGHRTRASVERAYTVFGLTRYLLISQGFHAERALYLAQRLKQNPLAFAAEEVPFQPQMALRELASRTVAVLEPYPAASAR
ncbi:MAG: SanA/YdcF family protein [Candidatus Sericytochromatia bacterium]